jgi:hypothetical protein
MIFQSPELAAESADTNFAYKSVLFLVLIIFIAPMNYIAALQPLRLALVFALLTMVTFVFTSLRQGRRLTVLGAEVKLILWLVFFAIVSITHSMWPGGSYEMLFDTFLKSIIVFLLIANLLTSESRFRGFFWALAVSAAFNAVVGIYNYRMGAFIGGNRIQGGFSGMTSNPNDLALCLDLMIPFVWFLFISARNSIQKLFTGMTLCISLICIVLTSSRGGAIIFLGMLVWYVWHRPSQNRVNVLVGTAVLIGIVLLVAPEGYSDRLVSSVDFSKDKTGSADARWEITKAGFYQTLAYPFGVGLGMTGLLNHEEGRGWSAGVHNVYLEISTELGIIPGVLFIVLLWKLIANLKRMRSLTARSANPHQLALLAEATECSLVGFAVGGLFSPVAYQFYFYILAGIAVAIKEVARLNSPLEGESSRDYPTWSSSYLSEAVAIKEKL